MGVPRTYRYWLLLAAGWTWLAAIVGSAWLADGGWLGGWLLHALFSPVCHQIPERSFAWGGAAFGVCHRCFGVYAGFASGLLLWPQLTKLAGLLLAHSRMLLLFVGLMVVDVLLPNQAWDRVVTGALVGLPAALFVWLGAEQFPGFKLWNTVEASAEFGARAESPGLVADLAGAGTNQRSVL